MHDALARQDVNKTAIKTRAIPLSRYIVGDMPAGEGSMVHITLLLLEGRSSAVKVNYGKPLFDYAKSVILPVDETCSVTLEIRDMERHTYFKD